MDTIARNKMLTWLVGLLFVANLATLAFFWMGRLRKPPAAEGGAREFIVRQLQFSKDQEMRFDTLVKDHRQKATGLRNDIRIAKEEMFDLLKQPDVSDSVKLAAARKVSSYTEALDLLTLEHFSKVRAICDASQQQKFDQIIHRIIGSMGRPAPPLEGRGPGPDGRGEEGDRMPPPQQ